MTKLTKVNQVKTLTPASLEVTMFLESFGSENKGIAFQMTGDKTSVYTVISAKQALKLSKTLKKLAKAIRKY